MHTKLPVIIIVLLSLALPASPAQAGGVISVCDEGHLLAALAGGGTVTFTCSGTITLTNTLIISSDTTIDGSGHDVIISGNDSVGVFYVNFGITLNLIELTVANGKTFAHGGGIDNEGGTVNVINSTFSGNSTDLYGLGGGIANGGTLTVNNSIFSNNNADGGGGISNIGNATVNNSTFSGNSANNYGGGGIYNYEGGRATVSNSTFSGNSATGIGGGGGGIFNIQAGLTVNSSTFSSNSATGIDGHGGGIWNAGGVKVSNSTFSGNSATGIDGRGGGISNYGGAWGIVSNSTFSGNSAVKGGGIYNYGDEYSAINLGNTIIANSLSGGNCIGSTITDGGGNLTFGDATCPGINSDPKLGPLQDNGGPTLTHALLPGSPAIDAAVAAICSAPPVNNLDQRGVSRPIDGNEDGNAICDIGAFEYQSPLSWIYLPMVWKD